MSTSKDIRYWIGFNLVKGIGAAKFRRLLNHFGDLETAWQAAPEELGSAGLDRRALEGLLAVRASVDLDRVWQQIENAGARVVTWNDADYPRNLLNIAQPPPVLYVKGTLTPADEWAVALVGTRRATAYGREVARTLAAGLAASGVTVVSGLARGIDAAAHQATLDAGGRTLAVMGTGIDIIYPPEHRSLAAAIPQAGALISDYPPGTAAESVNFPPRNRIISGLARGVVIIEAGESSGALITAEFAAEQGREVFAVPGSIFQPAARGANRLIKQGARPLLEVGDILEALDLAHALEQRTARSALPADAIEQRLWEHLSLEPLHVDELGERVGLPIAQVSSALALMELKGLVRQVGYMQYVADRPPATAD